MKKEVSLILSPAQAYSEESYLPIVAETLGMSQHNLSTVRIIRKSIDARGRNIRINITFEVFIGEEAPSVLENSYDYHRVDSKPEVVVIGAGPAGLFASLRLIELGYRPVLLDGEKAPTNAGRISTCWKTTTS